MNIVFLTFGAAFGFLLSRARATDYDAIVNMFRLTDLHLAGVMVTAIGVAAIGLYFLRRSQATALVGSPIEVYPISSHRWMLAAGLIFGIGWALTGA
jgi:hypothetical protein